MRKLMIFILLVLSVFPIMAQPESAGDITALARYFPEDAPVFMAFRVDESTRTAVDGVLTTIGERVGQPVPADATSMALEQYVTSMLGYYTGEELDVLEWVGDSIGFGTFDNISISVTVISVTNREAAEEDLATAMENAFTEFEQEEVNGATLYRPELAYYSGYLLTDDALFISVDLDMLETFASGARETSLLDSERFTGAIEALPADGYGAVSYIDVSAFVRFISNQGGDLPDVDWEALSEAFGPFAGGLTMLGDHSFAMDFAQLPGSTSLFEALDVATPTAIDYLALDLEFAANIPSSTIFYMQGSRIGSQIAALKNDLPAILDPLLAEYVYPEMEDVPNADFLEAFTIKRYMTFVDLMFKGSMDMALEEFFSGVNGQNAAYMMVRPDEEAGAVLENGMLLEITDAEQTAQMLNGIVGLLEDFKFPYEATDNGIVLPFGNSIPLNPQMMGVGFGETVLRVDDNLLYVGAASAGEFLNREDAIGLADTPAFTDAQNYFLPEATSLWFVNFAPLRELLQSEGFVEGLPGVSMTDIQSMRQVLGLIDSASVTQASQDGTVLTRWTVSLTR